jgi:hypothetical protein
METRYLKLHYNEALATKKELLSAEVNLLSMRKKLKEYKLLRKRELTLKKKLKTALSSLKIKMNLVLSTFPEEDREMPKPKRRKREGTQDNNLQNELEAIKKKLAKLN